MTPFVQPIAGTNTVTGFEVFVVGWGWDPRPGVAELILGCLDEDGRFHTVAASEVRADIRYDRRKGGWNSIDYSEVVSEDDPEDDPEDGD